MFTITMVDSRSWSDHGFVLASTWHAWPYVLLLRCLPALRKLCCLFHTEELTRHVEDITFFFLDMVLNMLFEHLKLLVPCLIVYAHRG